MKSLSSRYNLRPQASCTVVLEGAVSNFLKHSTSASLFLYTALTVLGGPGGLSGKALDYGLGGPGVGGVEIFLYSFMPRLALGSTQPPIKLVPWNFSGGKGARA